MQKLSLTMAISDYLHVADLKTGDVTPDGVDLRVLTLPPLEIFHRFLAYREWDISEMSFAKYVALLSQGDDSLVAIPVFPSRSFRHSSIWVGPGGPTDPRQLAGARVGVPEWAQTAGVCVRGMLADDHGVELAAVKWVQAGLNQRGRKEKVALRLPTDVELVSVPDKTLQDLLELGALDAIIAGEPPARLLENGFEVRRLFSEPAAVERSYWERTGVFPIMHVVVMTRDVLDRHPWVAMNLLKAFDDAKRRCFGRMLETGTSWIPVPWAQTQVLDTCAVLGWEADPWPYGVEANLTTLEAFTRWCFEQGIADRPLEANELFADQVQSRVRT